MAQFCRYCDHISVPGTGMAFCEVRNMLLTRDHLRHTNNCNRFAYNPIDALRLNRAGHKPREDTEESDPEICPGQTSIFDIEKKEEE